MLHLADRWVHWVAQPPLTEPAGFGHIEVPNVARVDGWHVLVFCCLAGDLDDARRARTPEAGTWTAPAASALGPYRLDTATPFEDPTLYAAHVVHLDGQGPALLGFATTRDGDFVGAIEPPVPVQVSPDGTLTRPGNSQRTHRTDPVSGPSVEA